jgi:glycosyltransferase involved in cell wall biosynthesis
MSISSKHIVTILIPVFNEELTIETIVQKIIHLKLENWQKQIIVIDDGSTDKTPLILKKHKKNITLITHDVNMGMGKALQSGFTKAKGDVILFQDADLEYSPSDIPLILDKYKDAQIKVVYGSRYMKGKTHRYVFYYAGAKLLTNMVNVFYKTHLTDICTGYKSFRTTLLPFVSKRYSGFEFNMELTLSFVGSNIAITEVPITYHPRSFTEGKKISLFVGFKNIWIIVTRWIRRLL